MAAAVTNLVPAYIVHRRPFSESSFVLEVFTAEYGRVGLLAKGARKRSGRGTGGVQPFQQLLVSWRGRGELPTLTSVEANRVALSLARKNLVSGLYVNELLLRLLHRHDPHPDLWHPYIRTLDNLVTATNPESTLRCFEMHLLSAIGYGLELSVDAQQNPIRDDCSYYYDGELGARVDNGPHAVSGAMLLALAREELNSPELLRDAKRLMRRLLHRRLDGKPLVSRSLMRP